MRKLALVASTLLLPLTPHFAFTPYPDDAPVVEKCIGDDGRPVKGMNGYQQKGGCGRDTSAEAQENNSSENG